MVKTSNSIHNITHYKKIKKLKPNNIMEFMLLI